MNIDWYKQKCTSALFGKTGLNLVAFQN